jgi:hypothetical protein
MSPTATGAPSPMPTDAPPPTATPATTAPVSPTPGAAPEILIAEIMIDPLAVPDRAGEWVELFNAGAAAVNLSGWMLADLDSDHHTIAADLWIEPGMYLVLGRQGDAAQNGGVSVAYVYGGVNHNNDAPDALRLLRPRWPGSRSDCLGPRPGSPARREPCAHHRQCAGVVAAVHCAMARLSGRQGQPRRAEPARGVAHTNADRNYRAQPDTNAHEHHPTHDLAHPHPDVNTDANDDAAANLCTNEYAHPDQRSDDRPTGCG